MDFRQHLITVLRSRDAQRIHLNFTGSSGRDITVNGSSFSRVADAIQNDTIHVVSGGVRDGWAKYSARAEGDSAANTFYIGANLYSSRDFDGLLIHESVHASFDLTRTTIPWLDNETAAYIAQGYYLRNTGYSRTRMDHLGMPYYGTMIVDSIVRGEGVDQFWVDALHGSLDSSPTYHSYIRGTFTGDG